MNVFPFWLIAVREFHTFMKLHPSTTMTFLNPGTLLVSSIISIYETCTRNVFYTLLCGTTVFCWERNIHSQNIFVVKSGTNALKNARMFKSISADNRKMWIEFFG